MENVIIIIIVIAQILLKESEIMTRAMSRYINNNNILSKQESIFTEVFTLKWKQDLPYYIIFSETEQRVHLLNTAL